MSNNNDFALFVRGAVDDQVLVVDVEEVDIPIGLEDYLPDKGMELAGDGDGLAEEDQRPNSSEGGVKDQHDTLLLGVGVLKARDIEAAAAHIVAATKDIKARPILHQANKIVAETIDRQTAMIVAR
jgi:hypothetical protein